MTTMRPTALPSSCVALSDDPSFALSRSSDRPSSRSTTPTRKRRKRSVLFDMKRNEVRAFDQNIQHAGLVWYTIWDFNEMRKENKAAVRQVLEARESSGDGVVGLDEFVRSSLRGLEYCYQDHGGNMALAIKLVLDNQRSVSPLILAARYSKLSKPSQLEALKRGRQDEKAVKGSNAAPVMPSRRDSRPGDASPLPPRRKVSYDRIDSTPRVPSRKTSSLVSEYSAQMQTLHRR